MEIKLVVKFEESCLFKNKDKGVKKHIKNRRQRRLKIIEQAQLGRSPLRTVQGLFAYLHAAQVANKLLKFAQKSANTSIIVCLHVPKQIIFQCSWSFFGVFFRNRQTVPFFPNPIRGSPEVTLLYGWGVPRSDERVPRE